MSTQTAEQTAAITLPAMWKARDVQTLLGWSRSKLDRLLSDQDSGFPKPFWLGGERYWLAESVRDWIMTRATGGTDQGAPEKRAA